MGNSNLNFSRRLKVAYNFYKHIAKKNGIGDSARTLESTQKVVKENCKWLISARKQLVDSVNFVLPGREPLEDVLLSEMNKFLRNFGHAFFDYSTGHSKDITLGDHHSSWDITNLMAYALLVNAHSREVLAKYFEGFVKEHGGNLHTEFGVSTDECEEFICGKRVLA